MMYLKRLPMVMVNALISDGKMSFRDQQGNYKYINAYVAKKERSITTFSSMNCTNNDAHGRHLDTSVTTRLAPEMLKAVMPNSVGNGSFGLTSCFTHHQFISGCRYFSGAFVVWSYGCGGTRSEPRIQKLTSFVPRNMNSGGVNLSGPDAVQPGVL